MNYMLYFLWLFSQHKSVTKKVVPDFRHREIFTAIGNLLFWLGFYAVSTVFKLFNGDSSQIHVSWTIFNQYLTSPLSWHWRASRSIIPLILSAKGESHYYQF